MPVVVPPTKTVMLKTLLEMVLMTVLALPMIYIHVIREEFSPKQRGFYCDDETLRHPYQDETVHMGVCFMVWFVLGLVIIIGLDFFSWSCRNGANSREKLILCGFEIPLIVAELYRSLGHMVFGAATTFLFTDTSKYQIGRLRPHFLTVCEPNIDLCKDPDTGFNVFVNGNDSECTSLEGLEGEELETQTKILHEARLSFMSGHSSYSFFCAMYLVIFLQLRVHKLPETGSSMKNTIRLLFKVVTPYIQFGLLVLAFFIALTRVSDYFHHPLDVLTGSMVGIIFAFWTIYVSGMASKETAFWKNGNAHN